MSGHDFDAVHDPGDLLDELDAVIAAQELLARRAAMLQARYRALQAQASAGRFDKRGPDGFRDEFGTVNVGATVNRVGLASDCMQSPLAWLSLARETAARVREYPPPAEREQSTVAEHAKRVVDRGRSR